MRSDLIFGWFGSSASVVLMGALFRKPSIIIAGGSDVAYVPEIGYGLNPDDKIPYHLFTRGFRTAKKVLLFSEASRRDYLKLPGVAADKSHTIYLGIDSDHFHPEGEKQRRVLTVSYISPNGLKRKGLLAFAEAARSLPEVPFRIAGPVIDKNAEAQLRAVAPPNVELLGYLDDAQLLKEFQAAKVYAQLSHHEGFGASLAEAMACGCVPVATQRGSIPEVVGDTGHYVPVDDAAAAAAAFRAALEAPADGRPRARIVEMFQPKRRQQALLAFTESVLRS
jgi:glycosyltransferase involved in cell wall biosynthesis